jgi:hypothetical protein
MRLEVAGIGGTARRCPTAHGFAARTDQWRSDATGLSRTPPTRGLLVVQILRDRFSLGRQPGCSGQEADTARHSRCGPHQQIRRAAASKTRERLIPTRFEETQALLGCLKEALRRRGLPRECQSESQEMRRFRQEMCCQNANISLQSSNPIDSTTNSAMGNEPPEGIQPTTSRYHLSGVAAVFVSVTLLLDVAFFLSTGILKLPILISGERFLSYQNPVFAPLPNWMVMAAAIACEVTAAIFCLRAQATTRGWIARLFMADMSVCILVTTQVQTTRKRCPG